MNNVETMSNLPWIVLNGGAAFAALGQGQVDGDAAVRAGRARREPGWYELEMSKTTFRDLIFDPKLGGGIRGGRELKAIIPGGVSAPWFGPDKLDLRSRPGRGRQRPDRCSARARSWSMDDSTCVVRAAWRITRFFHRESCGQCTPCREGAGWLEKILARIEGGNGRGSRPRPVDGCLRQHRAGGELAAAADDDLRARPVDPVVDRVGDPDVPRRVPRCT